MVVIAVILFLLSIIIAYIYKSTFETIAKIVSDFIYNKIAKIYLEMESKIFND